MKENTLWYKIKDNQISLKIFVKPNAKKTALLKIDGNGLHIALHAKPVEGEANKELINFLSNLFNIPKSYIILEKGDHSRNKTVLLPLNDKVRNFIAKIAANTK